LSAVIGGGVPVTAERAVVGGAWIMAAAKVGGRGLAVEVRNLGCTHGAGALEECVIR